MNGDNTYEQRNSIKSNRGEQLFLQWCRDKGLEVHRLGFDEKQDKVSHFFQLPTIVRNLPDFVLADNDKLILVNVKGSMNFKAEEYSRLNELTYHYENDQCKLWYVFALPGELKWMTLDQVREAYDSSTKEGVWPDGKSYRTL